MMGYCKYMHIYIMWVFVVYLCMVFVLGHGSAKRWARGAIECQHGRCWRGCIKVVALLTRNMWKCTTSSLIAHWSTEVDVCLLAPNVAENAFSAVCLSPVLIHTGMDSYSQSNASETTLSYLRARCTGSCVLLPGCSSLRKICTSSKMGVWPTVFTNLSNII